MRSQAETEKQFAQAIVDLATRLGYLVHRVHDSRRAPAGWPDLFLVHAAKRDILVLECKSDGGRLTPAQAQWLDALSACGLECQVVRPYDFDAIAQRLQRRPPQEEPP